MKLTVGALWQACGDLPDDTPVVFAETSDVPGVAMLAPIGDVDEIDANLNYTWDGEDLDESGMAGEPAVVIWWKDASLERTVAVSEAYL